MSQSQSGSALNRWVALSSGSSTSRTSQKVNKWDAAGKLQSLKVRLGGRAQAALQRFSAVDATDYSSVKERLQERFEPSC